MNNRVVKKAKKGIFSLVFSRSATIFLLIFLQLAFMVTAATTLQEYIIYMYGAFQVVGAVILISLINQKGNPAFTMTWMLLILIFPAFGCLFYIWVKAQLGARYIGKRLRKLRQDTSSYMMQDPEVVQSIRSSKPANANLSYYMQHQIGFPTYRNTRVEYFPSGEEKFPIFLQELQKAQHFIFLEYFIVEEGFMWESILEILKEKAAKGVEVRFMYDGMCSISMLPYNYPKQLKKYGIQCKMFSPIRPVLSTTQNNRDHRKICVIDGKVGFTGGINLGDEYINQKERFGYWKDTAIMLTGDAVQSLTMMFLQMWNVTEKKAEDFSKYTTTMSAQVHRELGYMIPYGDSPYDNEDVGKEVYFHILNHAKKYVHIMTPYLILDNEMIDTLTRAAKSGIEVCIIMPHIPDKWYAFAVAKTYYKELIEAGVQIYEFTPGFVHAKVFVSDDDTATVGTVNLDYRSLYLHFECGVFIYNNPTVWEIEKDFQATLKRCERVSVMDLGKVSLWMRLCGRVLRLIAPLM